jgi:ABC-type multidrug transport system fused ATPase/permease subunit
MFLLMILDIFINVADIAFLALLLAIIHSMTGPPASKGFFSLPARLTGTNPLLLIISFFLLFSIKNLVGFLIYRAQCRSLFQIAARISENNLVSYQQGSYDNHINVDSSVHIRQVSYQPLEFCQHVLGGMQQVVTQTVLIVLSVTAIVLFNAKLFLIILAILLPPVIAIFYGIKLRMRSARGSARISSERSLRHLQEALAGFVENNVYDKNETFLQRFISWQQQYGRYLSNQTIVQGLPGRIIEVFALLGVVILIAIGSGNNGQTSVITIGVFMAAAYKIIPGIVKLLALSGQINTYAFTVDHLVSTQSAADDDNLPLVVEPIRSLQLKGVSFRYEERPVLDTFDLHLTTGEFLGISGPSGKGKTTILHLILGFLTPLSGEIWINDEPADTGFRRACWPRIAYVRQQSFLVHDSILNNITLFDSPCRQEALQAAIEMAGLQELIASFPEGAHRIIRQNGGDISGGQRQRIAIARALYKEADLLIFDEPFNQLDEASEVVLLNHLRELAASGKMILLITHNKKGLSWCDRVISLEGLPTPVVADQVGMSAGQAQLQTEKNFG